ncbi:hypothetical protein NEOLEDRAFT_1141449 [Neolentinus lepideus HHB14362 ss-1]|uniref:Uncharacterized protein n=1 Tax=Neolentinus lepideus HHB14362 ss-1 TaxID=1314782 RepID=A0A165NMG3_9AGAM|nr:hypothetical protein NEOLEDRAFT_1141449 [Neolentinus lepideus HHB14362 ss-1]
MCPTALVALIATDKVLNPTTMEIRDIGAGSSLSLLQFAPPVLGDNVTIESADADLDAYYEEQYVE